MDLFSRTETECHILEVKHLIKGLEAVSEKKDNKELSEDCIYFCRLASEKIEQVYNEVCKINEEYQNKINEEPVYPEPL